MDTFLNQEIINQRLSNLQDWKLVDSSICLEKKFQDFLQAMEFVNKLIEPSEHLQHHPDITISYNKVSLRLTTHDAGGVTEKDFELAQKISKI